MLHSARIKRLSKWKPGDTDYFGASSSLKGAGGRVNVAHGSQKHFSEMLKPTRGALKGLAEDRIEN